MWPLIQQFGDRIIYDAGNSWHVKVADYIRHDDWAMPNPISRDLITMCSNLPDYKPKCNREDKVEWVLNSEKEFSCKSAWQALRTQYPQVEWAGLVWHKEYIPRCSLICWLASKNRLRTKEKLHRWGIVTDEVCVLCGQCREDRDHLFFRCVFLRQIWNDVLYKCNQRYRRGNWQNEVQEATQRFRGKQFSARIGRVAFAVTLYCIW